MNESFHFTNVQPPADQDPSAWIAVNQNFLTLANSLARLSGRISDLETEVEKLRAAKGIGNDKPGSD